MTDSPGMRPRRRHLFTLNVGADSVEDLSNVLADLATRLALGEVLTPTSGPANGASGGFSTGYTWIHTVDPAVTHERYENELRLWRDRERRGGEA